MPIQRILGLTGSVVIATGVFLPLLRYVELGSNSSLWDSYRWVAAIVLVLVAVAVYCCGAGLYRNLLPLAIVICGVLSYPLWSTLSTIRESTAQATHMEQTGSSGWAGLVRTFMPSLHWAGWTVIAGGAVLMSMSSSIAAKRWVAADAPPQPWPEAKHLKPPARLPSSMNTSRNNDVKDGE